MLQRPSLSSMPREILDGVIVNLMPADDDMRSERWQRCLIDLRSLAGSYRAMYSLLVPYRRRRLFVANHPHDRSCDMTLPTSQAIEVVCDRRNAECVEFLTITDYPVGHTDEQARTRQLQFFLDCLQKLSRLRSFEIFSTRQDLHLLTSTLCCLTRLRCVRIPYYPCRLDACHALQHLSLDGIDCAQSDVNIYGRHLRTLRIRFCQPASARSRINPRVKFGELPSLRSVVLACDSGPFPLMEGTADCVTQLALHCGPSSHHCFRMDVLTPFWRSLTQITLWGMNDPADLDVEQSNIRSFRLFRCGERCLRSLEHRSRGSITFARTFSHEN